MGIAPLEHHLAATHDQQAVDQREFARRDIRISAANGSGVDAQRREARRAGRAAPVGRRSHSRRPKPLPAPR
jgi:hypothetical protein